MVALQFGVARRAGRGRVLGSNFVRNDSAFEADNSFAGGALEEFGSALYGREIHLSEVRR
jgi:hypothetical protein